MLWRSVAGGTYSKLYMPEKLQDFFSFRSFE